MYLCVLPKKSQNIWQKTLPKFFWNNWESQVLTNNWALIFPLGSYCSLIWRGCEMVKPCPYGFIAATFSNSSYSQWVKPVAISSIHTSQSVFPSFWGGLDWQGNEEKLVNTLERFLALFLTEKLKKVLTEKHNFCKVLSNSAELQQLKNKETPPNCGPTSYYFY